MNHRRLGATCLVLAALLYAATTLLWPRGSEGSTADQVAAAAGSPGRWVAAGLTEAVSGWALLVAVLAVLALVRGRGRVFALVAAVLCVLGAFADQATGAVNAFFAGTATGPDAARAAAVYDSVTDRGYLTPFLVLVFAGLVGQLLLPWAALRAGLVRWWVPALITAGVLVETFLADGAEGTTAALYYLPLVAGALLFAADLVREPRPAEEPAFPAVEVDA